MIFNFKSLKKMNLEFSAVRLDTSFSKEDIKKLIALILSKEVDKNNQYSGGRTDFSYGSKEFKFFLENNKSLKNITDELKSKTFWNELSKSLLNQDSEIKSFFPIKNPFFFPFEKSGFLQKILDKLRRSNLGIVEKLFLKLIRGDHFELTINLGIAYSGYYVPPHLDNRNKLIVGLIYLSGSETQDLLLCKSLDEKNIGNRLLNANQFLVIKRFRQNSNKAIFIENTNDSYHATEDFSSKDPKVFIYTSIALPGIEKIFKSNKSYLRDHWPNVT